MNYSNLHTHTTFSDGIGSVKENIEAAINKNMQSLGFSDHSFTDCDKSYCMKLEDFDEYLLTVNNAKSEYKDKIKIFTGIEKDYFSDIDVKAFDYFIGSVHYVIKNDICYPIDHSAKQQLDCIADAFGGSAMDFAKCYFDMVVEQAIKYKPTLIGHFDVINKFSLMPENDDKYIQLTLDSVAEILKYTKVFEVNTGAISRGYRSVPYPNIPVLEFLYKKGGVITLGSDSHNPKNLDFFFSESIEIIKKVGFKEIAVFNGTDFDMVKI
ncbi:MAG: histidinol-phosphatase [Acutalibacteraceae bacterium]|nr:histidinol-phosphatase [Acutalibacteraceae bacterium]